MSVHRDNIFRNNFQITQKCSVCPETKPVAAFTAGNKGMCNVCKAMKNTIDQVLVNKRRKLMFDKEIRDANREHDFMTDRELRG